MPLPAHSLSTLVIPDFANQRRYLEKHLGGAARPITPAILKLGPAPMTLKCPFLDSSSVTSLIPETLVPLSTRRYPCVADVLTSSGDTSRMSEYVIASYVDEVGDKHEFPLIKWKQSDHIIIGIVDPPLFGYTSARLLPHNRLDQMRLALVNGAMNRSAPANPLSMTHSVYQPSSVRLQAYQKRTRVLSAFATNRIPFPTQLEPKR